MIQKLIRVYSDNFYDLENYQKEGWRISNISSLGTSSSTFCYVLLEKPDNSSQKIINE